MADIRYEINHNGEIVEGKSALCSNQTQFIIDLFSQFGCKSVEKSKEGSHHIISINRPGMEKEEWNVYSGTIRNEARNPYEKKIQLNGADPRKDSKDNTIILGIYVFNENDKYSDAIFVGYPIDNNIKYDTNPSIRGTFINKILVQAKTSGIVYDEEHNVVGFRPEFAFYYLDNYYNIHYKKEFVHKMDDVVYDAQFNEDANNEKNVNIKNVLFNRIVYGAPGTGKSHHLTKDIQKYIPKYSQADYSGNDVFRTTLHPEYSYYDFVGSVKPKVVKGNDGKDDITYEFTQGIFTKALIQAFKSYYCEDENIKPVFLILEEMSRANVAAVFGDIFQLLDRNDRKEPGRSEYRIKNDDILKALKEAFKDSQIKEIENMSEIYIPSNLFIWGTVNTSDQNVFIMDNAFKRRFNEEYESIRAKKDEKGNYLNNYKFLYNNAKDRIPWVDFYQNLDSYIVGELKLSEDKQLGQFYIQFKNPESINSWDDAQINHKLILYLWNDIKGASLRNNVDIFAEGIYSYGEAFEKYERLLRGDNIEVFSKSFIENVIEKKNDVNE